MRAAIEFSTRNHYGSGTIHSTTTEGVYAIGRPRVGHIGIGAVEAYIKNGRNDITVEMVDFGDTWISFKIERR